MRYRIIIASCLILLCGSEALSQSQQSGRVEKNQYVVVPREIILPVVVSQPDSPLQFENVKGIGPISGNGGGVRFQLRNRGSKPIRGVSFAVLTTSGGLWFSDSWPRKLTGEVVMPGQIVPLSNEDQQIEVVPLTEELREKLKLRGPMKAVILLMVTAVEFTDGTTYNDEPTQKALETYLEGLSSRADSDN
ncbi:hypothetical protein BH18ACI2_BH18ACI2_04640 [soil metagenome]